MASHRFNQSHLGALRACMGQGLESDWARVLIDRMGARYFLSCVADAFEAIAASRGDEVATINYLSRAIHALDELPLIG